MIGPVLLSGLDVASDVWVQCVARMNTSSRKKDEIVRIRMTAAQKRALVTAAARDGLELSTWMRHLALRAAARR
jgi:hypothetical protein